MGEAAGAIVLDPVTGAPRQTISFGTSPSSVAVGEGSVWVLDGDDKTVTQIDPASREVRRVFSTSSRPTDIVAGAGAVWVGDGPSRGLSDYPESVSRIDPASGVVVGTVALPPAPGGHVGMGSPLGDHLIAYALPDPEPDPDPGRAASTGD